MTNYYLWLDLETTGLNEHEGAVLEVAWILTTTELEQLYQNSFVAFCPNWRELADDYVTNMHTESGLAADLYKVNNSLEFIESQILEHLDAVQTLCAPEDAVFHLAGGSIHFDRRWVKKHMKKLEERLHYRMLDISSLKVAFGRHGLPPDKKAHRAMADVQESLDALVHYRELLNYEP